MASQQPSKMHPNQSSHQHAKSHVGKNYSSLSGAHKSKKANATSHDLSMQHYFANLGSVQVSDKITQRMSENVAMVCYDKQYDKIENHALFVLTDLIKEFALEIGTEIKRNGELCGRSQPNLIDALIAAEEYEETKDKQTEFMKSQELSLVPYKQSDFTQKANATSSAYRNKLLNRQNPMDRMKEHALLDLQQKLFAGQQKQDSLQAIKQRAQIINSIPEAFLNCLPIQQSIFPLQDVQGATSKNQGQNEYQGLREVVQINNQSYERMQRIEKRRLVENGVEQTNAEKDQEMPPAIAEANVKINAVQDKDQAENQTQLDNLLKPDENMNQIQDANKPNQQQQANDHKFAFKLPGDQKVEHQVEEKKPSKKKKKKDKDNVDALFV